MKRISSVIYGKDCDVLNLMFPFYAPEAKIVIDVCCNARRMWKGVNIPVKCYDIDPEVKPDVICSWDALPDEDSSVDVLVCDPPHLPSAAASEKSIKHYGKNYGLGLATHKNDLNLISFLQEAIRVLKNDGLIFAKIKDYVHNHKYRWNLCRFVQDCEKIGLCPCDLIIKVDPAGGNLKSGRWKKSHHARNCHCYWIVVRKGKCEPHS